MSELLTASRLVILARHDLTPANRAKYEGSNDSRIQGLSPDMPLDDIDGGVRSHALGMALGKFITKYNLKIVEVHSSRLIAQSRHEI